MRASLAQRCATRAMPGFSTFFPKTDRSFSISLLRFKKRPAMTRYKRIWRLSLMPLPLRNSAGQRAWHKTKEACVAAIRALLLMVALVSPALAQTSFADGAALAARAVDAAKELRTHLAEPAKAGARPDFSNRPPRNCSAASTT